MRCKILNAISRKHFHYSLFVKGIIAIEAQFSCFQWGAKLDYEKRLQKFLVSNLEIMICIEKLQIDKHFQIRLAIEEHK